jgi:acyl carrier protein
MEIKEFIENFANQFDDTEASEFAAETNFRDLDEWSSMIGLSVLNMAEKSYGVQLTFDELRAANTVQDLFDVISKKQG